MTEKELRQDVGQRLQEIRGRRDQRTFAEAVASVQQTISKYERGEIPRSWLFLARLAEAEGIDLNGSLPDTASASRPTQAQRLGPHVPEREQTSGASPDRRASVSRVAGGESRPGTARFAAGPFPSSTLRLE